MSIFLRGENVDKDTGEILPVVIEVPFNRMRHRCCAVVEGQSVTKQSFADECDINRIMARYAQTGVLPETVNTVIPRYEDVSGVPDFFEALQVVNAAEASFASQSAEVRARFRNDPGEFVLFLNDEANRPEAEKMGLVKPRPVKNESGGGNPTPLPG